MLFASVVVGWKTLVLGVRGEKVVRDWDLRRAYEESGVWLSRMHSHRRHVVECSGAVGRSDPSVRGLA